MIVETGHIALCLALAMAIIQMAVMPIVRPAPALALRLANTTSVLTFVLTLISFAALTYAYVGSDFSVLNVYMNSHSLKPLVYKISGVWGNHEGSLLLWVLVLALFGAMVALFHKGMASDLKAMVLAVQGLVAAAFFLFILFTSNPFERLVPPPLEGRDLNPLLQDIGLAIHPPLLYVGYVGFSIAFSFAAGALILGRIDAVWARAARPWVLVAWIFLTLGIAMGSYWAYYELGWGGWWFWDPVENASFMPWLVGTALLHSIIVMEKREALKIWTILLAVLTFSLSLLGTFIVRSGILTSVHAFATDPERGVFILGILVFFVGGSLALFAWRSKDLAPGGIFAPVSREGALVFNNLFLTAACLAVLVGTLYPLALEFTTGQKISVGPPFFNATTGPLLAPLALALPFGQRLAWKRGDLLGVLQRLWIAIGIGIAAVVVALAVFSGGHVLALFGLGLGAFTAIASLLELYERATRQGGSIGAALLRMVRLPASAWGTSLAHFGVGIFVIGVAATAFHEERIANMKAGDRLVVGGYTLRLDRIESRRGPNFIYRLASFTVRDGDGGTLGTMEPGKRSFNARAMSTTETARLTRGLGQIYLATGEETIPGTAPVRAYWKPMVLLLWIGPLFMAIGGALSMSDRRLRIGAPAKAKTRALPAGGAHA
jgi:cytochrome c-type biogenesis protein CcmF